MGLKDLDGVSGVGKTTSTDDKESPGWLLSQVMEDKSEREIAKEAGYSRSKVNRLLNKYGIERDRANSFQVGVRIEDYPIIIGGVLGDASISQRGERSARYRHDDTYREYLEYLKEEVPALFEGNSVKESDSQDIYYLQSKTCVDMYWLRRVLYYKDDKVFPHTNTIQSRALKHWYIGDGTLRKGNAPEISCRWIGQSNIMAAIECLKKTLDTEQITIRGPYPREDSIDISIAFNGDARGKFFDYIGDCPVGCYEYKWP